MRADTGDYPERERLRDLLFAYPEGCDETRTTPVSSSDYLVTRREWMQQTVRTCGRYGLALAEGIFDVAFMTDEQLRKQKKPEHVRTWFDCGEELTAEIQRYIAQT